MTILKTAKIFLFTMLLVMFAGCAYAQEDITIYTVKENYKPAKYEPSKGIYLGAYVLQDTVINASMEKFNQLTGKKHASFFRYVGYGKPFPKEWVEQVKAAGAVPHIAWEPNDGLDVVKDNEYLRTFAKEAGKASVPIFLRYASEMNGTWCTYSGSTKEYIEKWKLIHNVMEEEAPNVIMVWTVFTFPDYNITSYYPGDQYVDWVGVNIYNVVYHNGNLREKAVHEDPLDLLNFVYNTFSHKKPIQISEYGATHYTTTDGKYYVDFARQKIARIYANLPTKYPRVKSIFYFDVNNLVNAPEGRKINDYSITNDENILNTYAKLTSSKSYLSDVVESSSETSDEKLSYRGYTFSSRGRTYVDADFFKTHLGLRMTIKGSTVWLSDGKGNVYDFTMLSRRVPKGYYNSYKYVRGLQLREVASKFGYKVIYNKSDNSVTILGRGDGSPVPPSQDKVL